MKIRLGFVSNSSSSSFILSAPKDKPLTITLDVESSGIGTVITTEQELQAYFSDEYDDEYAEDSYLKARYDEALEELHKGRKVLAGRVANDDDNVLSRMLYESGLKLLKSDDVKIISGD